jgi:hypothetical protein
MKLSSLLIGSTLALLGGCMQRGGGDGDLAVAEAAIDGSDAAEAEGNVMMATIDGVDASAAAAASPEALAVRIAANVAVRWNPDGCAVVAQSGRTIAITYNDCTGPRGLVHVTGRLDLEVSVSAAGAITVHGTSADLQIDRAHLAIDADATYRATAAGHELEVHTAGSGTGPRGLEVERDGDYTIEWETASQCARITGAWSTSVGAAERGNDVDVRRCVNACPTGTITHRFLGDGALTITFDGTETAAWSTSAGAAGTFDLACR